MARFKPTTFSILSQTISFGYLLLSILNPAFAVQPMSESDLEIVSATTGSNILNIFGNSKAGLKVETGENVASKTDSTLATEQFKEGEATKPIALNQLRTLEDDSQSPVLDNSNVPNVTNSAQSAIIKETEQTTGSASVFSTNSEIKYKTSNVHHEMRPLENDGVAVSRDLQIDRLKLENLRGDSNDGSRSAGSIYLSDWRSQGDTRIFNSR